jgi:DNA polymerase
MLRAIGVGLVAPTREHRAVYVVADAAGGDGAQIAAAIAAVAPRCVLALGRASAAALLGADAPFGSLRGRVHAHAGVPVVVTFAPAFLLRQPAEKAKAWADLCLAVGALSAS